MAGYPVRIAVTHRCMFIPHNGLAKSVFGEAITTPEPVLRRAVVCPFAPPPGSWCGQCDRKVHANEARACGSPWCKAKVSLVEAEARR